MNSNIYLSPHFKLNEFTKSRTASQHGIDNAPPPEAVENLRALCIHTLEPLREALGIPIIITSGYRCKVLNERITHHSATSQHMQGEAADFVVQGSKFKVQGSKIKVQGSKINALTGSSKLKEQGENHRELLIKAFRTIILNDNIDFDQLIIYPSFIHVSYESRDKNRHRITKANGHGHYRALTREEALELM
ncbi:Peptidase M15 [Prevotella communis]|uniref:Peptidase M15 n=1 Tax=Prevotella communis TaxID=2913614 RepID=A0A1G7VX10_9BACT|nr:D-Ala-D-Ala carboxypeptidase family metallohydrolase [Prevotella communis]SDG63420.1 Peptidase M15 [Prevotella communis]